MAIHCEREKTEQS